MQKSEVKPGFFECFRNSVISPEYKIILPNMGLAFYTNWVQNKLAIDVLNINIVYRLVYNW